MADADKPQPPLAQQRHMQWAAAALRGQSGHAFQETSRKATLRRGLNSVVTNFTMRQYRWRGLTSSLHRIWQNIFYRIHSCSLWWITCWRKTLPHYWYLQAPSENVTCHILAAHKYFTNIYCPSACAFDSAYCWQCALYTLFAY